MKFRISNNRTYAVEFEAENQTQFDKQLKIAFAKFHLAKPKDSAYLHTLDEHIAKGLNYWLNIYVDGRIAPVNENILKSNSYFDDAIKIQEHSAGLNGLCEFASDAAFKPKLELVASEMGKKGGSAKTPAKKKSSAENGKLGGRPKGSGKKKVEDQ